MTFRQFQCLILLFTCACSRGGPGGFFGDGKASVSVEKVLTEEKQPTITLPAVLEPSEKVEIQFPFDAKIERVLVNLGDTVRQGDLLFTLNDQDFNLKMAQLKAQKLEQEALLDKNNYFLRTRDRLLEEGKIDKSLYDSLEAEVRSLETQLNRIKTDISVIENQAHGLNVTSPISGMVTVKNIVPGAGASARQVLMTLVKNDPILVSFNMPASDAQAVNKGVNLSVRVEDFPEKNLNATVVFVAPELDGASHNFNVKAAMANPQLVFKGGMSAQTAFVSPNKTKILAIPSKSVLSDMGKEYVYVVRQSRAWRVRVYTRKSPDNPAVSEIMEGLEPDDMVVTEGQEKLKEGAEVNLWR
ncbi:MAG: efflux RND transporter periplasmic adaptor subunit [Deltaproteobacteria bacterium]|nr:efflux RND transporter periplasmic adaptor subunit [Deltaproteobacteria bacterium]MDZ4224918.1 efflux RND transporter periplasmic adaptor subunit [bacterium]